MADENTNAETETAEQIAQREREEAIAAGEIVDDAGGEQDENESESTGKTEPDEDPDPDLDADTLAAIAGAEKPRMVPHARFNEVNEEAKTYRAKMLELEEELARLKGTQSAKPEPKEAPPEFDFDDAEERYTAAVLDGETAKAKAIRSEIRAEERKAADKRAEEAADRRYKENRQKDDEQRNKLEFDLEVTKAYAAHPFLDSANADANPEAIDEALVWHSHFLSKGKTPAQALAAAVAKVAPRYTKPAEPQAAPEPKPDIAQGIQRAEKVPPRPAGVGERASVIDVSKMSTKDIKSLSPEDEARLAGDMVG